MYESTLKSALERIVRGEHADEEIAGPAEHLEHPEPTGYDALAIALWNKATAGDIAAIREIVSILTPSGAPATVVIIDDIQTL